MLSFLLWSCGTLRYMGIAHLRNCDVSVSISTSSTVGTLVICACLWLAEYSLAQEL